MTYPMPTVSPLHRVLHHWHSIVSPGNEDSSWPLAIQKGACSIRNPYPTYNFLNYHHLSRSYYSFTSP